MLRRVDVSCGELSVSGEQDCGTNQLSGVEHESAAEIGLSPGNENVSLSERVEKL